MAQRVRLPADWRRFDRAGLIGSLLFPLLLGTLWFTGFGPWDQSGCEAASKVLQLTLSTNENKIVLSGTVASQSDKKLLIREAESVYGKPNVVDQISVDAAVIPITWASNVTGLMQKLKVIDQPAGVRIDGPDVTIEGTVADQATKLLRGREAAALIGKDVKLQNRITIRPPAEVKKEPVAAPAPVAAPTPAAEPAPIAAGTLGKRTLPSGTEITIAGGGLESQVIAFIEDTARTVDKGIWFDFDRLQFQTGSSTLTAESVAQVETMAAILKAYPDVAIKIGGYTDNVGDPGSNLKLSGTRAERVKQELITLGIAAGRLEAEGYGEQHPIADNSTAEGRAKNRRTAVSVRRK